MKATIGVVTCLLIVSAVSCEAWADVPPFCLDPFKNPVSMTTTAAKVNVSRYMGKWFEVARMPMWGQNDCICSQAEYEWVENHVSVINTCITTEFTSRSIEGKAVAMNDYNSKLQVFFPSQPAPGNYWILNLDVDYKWVVVGEPCMKFAWILSREKTLGQDIVQEQIGLLKSKGFDVSKLIFRSKEC